MTETKVPFCISLFMRVKDARWIVDNNETKAIRTMIADDEIKRGQEPRPFVSVIIPWLATCPEIGTPFILAYW